MPPDASLLLSKKGVDNMGKIQKGIRLPLVDLDEEFHQLVHDALVHAGVTF